MQNEETRVLLGKRRVFKQRHTLFEKYFKTLKESFQDTSPTDRERFKIAELKLRLEKYEKLIQEYEIVQTEIEISSDDLDTQTLERETFEKNYFSLLVECKEFLSIFDKVIPNSHSESSNSSNFDVGSSNNNKNDFNVKLPEIKLPKFTGCYDNWLEFRDTFDSLINENSSITNIQKFHYLRAALDGGAMQVIRSIEFSADNYQIAWNSLLQRYNNNSVLVNNHVKAIFEMPTLSKESASDLRKMLDSLSKHLCSLKNLNQPVEHWDTLLVFVLSHKLDKSTLRAWEQVKAATTQGNSDTVTLKTFKDFLRSRADFLETVLMTKEVKIQSHSYQISTKFKTECIFCKGSNHYIQNCNDFLKLSTQDRLNQLKNRKLCLNCLRGFHTINNCLAGHCKKCTQKHNTNLHNDFQVNSNPERPTTSSNNAFSATSSIASDNILLSTALVQIKNSKGYFQTCRVLLDSGSQSNFITEDTCKRLGLKTFPVSISVSGIVQTPFQIKQRCNITVVSMHNSFKADISCLLLPTINKGLPFQSFDLSNLNIPSNLRLADPGLSVSSKIDILIGAEWFYNLLCIGQFRLGPNLPTLQKTVLGWVVSGKLYNDPIAAQSMCNFSTSSNDEIYSLLKRFWEVEETVPPGSNVKFSSDEQLCEDIFSKTTERKDDGRFIVHIPLKCDPIILGDSREIATKRFYSLEKKLNREPKLKEEYAAFMNEYIQLGHMREISKIDEHSNSGFLPHHAVVNENNQTTKLRVVFDGSAQTDNGISFNSLQLVGPTIQDNLFSILLRFRQGPIVICADIVKMYRQIEIHRSQKHLQNILWRFDSSEELKTFELQTVTYGTASAPWLATRCLKQLTIDYSKIFPQSSHFVASNFYMDDLLISCNSESEALTICDEISKILSSGCFQLQKWATNSTKILQHIQNPSTILKIGKDQRTKILGLYWSYEDDQLMYTIADFISLNKFTKRTIMSDIAQIFDPLGLLGPCIILGKILLQSLWSLKLDWDESLPATIDNQWRQLRQELPVLNILKIPRFVSNTSIVKLELHGFADASLQAYGACLYIRSISSSGEIQVKLLTAKSRVSPLKSLTIPRLELCGALLLAQLVDRVKNSMTFTFDDIFLWCDSTVSLAWIRTSPSTLQVFVQNRVAQIQRLTQPNQWHHVRTADNPADFLSRGILPRALLDCTMWWNGPQWLSQPKDQWPYSAATFEGELPEVKKQKIILAAFQTSNWININKFSNLMKLQRVVAYCLRFIYNCRNPTDKQFKPFKAKDLSDTLRYLITISQKDDFAEEIQTLQRSHALPRQSKLLSLNPFLDDEGILRVGGRLSQSNFSFDVKHPILLSSKHHLTKLLFRHEHLRLFHAGQQQLLYSIRQRYWPLAGRNLAKQIVHSCIKCYRCKPLQPSPIMGNLPKARVTPAPPFYNTGIDYAGPVYLSSKKGRGAKVSKAYIALFVCFVTKATHLELVSDLSKDAFIAAFRRFVARRGKPSNVYSDNGTNFVGANSELRELSQFLKSQEHSLQDSISNIGVNWHFIPAFSPHFGGIWEAGVKSAKRHLTRIIGSVKLTFEEYCTILAEVEAILNSRPITPMSSDPNDLSALTPSHFLIGQPATSLPDPDLRDISTSRLSRYQLMQQCQQHFWSRWTREFLSELQLRTKWKTQQAALQVGSLVVLRDDHSHPLQWKLGRIVLLHPGSDGIARVATIKTSSGTVKRSFAKFCVLPIEVES